MTTGDDISGLLLDALDQPLESGDVVLITSKVVSKAAGLATHADKETLLGAETDRVVAQRGQTRIVRTHHGLTLAAAGIDASNIPLGQIIPLPANPDHDAEEIRERIQVLAKVDVAVIITDTAGRAWRIGQTDIAIGAAGIAPHLDFSGVDDSYGNSLVVTSPAIADEIAGAADLVAGKLGGTPFVVVRGLPTQWLLEEPGPGASALIREEDGDLFGLGARDAVLVAASTSSCLRGFPQFDETSAEELKAAALDGIDTNVADIRIVSNGHFEVYSPKRDLGASDWLAMGALAERTRILARAFRHSLVTTFRDQKLQQP